MRPKTPENACPKGCLEAGLESERGVPGGTTPRFISTNGQSGRIDPSPPKRYLSKHRTLWFLGFLAKALKPVGFWFFLNPILWLNI